MRFYECDACSKIRNDCETRMVTGCEGDFCGSCRDDEDAVVDVRVVDHGSIVLLHPVTDEAKVWFDENVNQIEGAFWHGAWPVERRFVDSILKGLDENFFTMEMVA